MRGRSTRLVIVVILTIALYLSLRWVTFTFEAQIEGMMVRIEYQRVEKGVDNLPELIMP